MNFYNILVLGSNGQIGKEIYNISNQKKNLNFYFKNKKELDICRTKEIEKVIDKKNIHIVINCAAFTSVDLAEKCKQKCIEINYYSVKNLAKLCKKNKLILIHFSTDYVFDGKKLSFYI